MDLVSDKKCHHCDDNIKNICFPNGKYYDICGCTKFNELGICKYCGMECPCICEPDELNEPDEGDEPNELDESDKPNEVKFAGENEGDPEMDHCPYCGECSHPCLCERDAILDEESNEHSKEEEDTRSFCTIYNDQKPVGRFCGDDPKKQHMKR